MVIDAGLIRHVEIGDGRKGKIKITKVRIGAHDVVGRHLALPAARRFSLRVKLGRIEVVAICVAELAIHAGPAVRHGLVSGLQTKETKVTLSNWERGGTADGKANCWAFHGSKILDTTAVPYLYLSKTVPAQQGRTRLEILGCRKLKAD